MLPRLPGGFEAGKLHLLHSGISMLRPEGLVRIAAGGRCCHLLLRRGGAVLVDTGGPEHLELIRQALTLNGLEVGSIQAVLLTHGSVLDAFNARWIRDRAGARVYIHRFDEARLNLRHPPGGASAPGSNVDARGAVTTRYPRSTSISATAMCWIFGSACA
jgi:glyoxylase-like metal-dependent hydrolase (beta-lactamase superfamily II)